MAHAYAVGQHQDSHQIRLRLQILLGHVCHSQEVNIQPRARCGFAPDHSQGAGGHQGCAGTQGRTDTGCKNHIFSHQIVILPPSNDGRRGDTNSAYTKLVYGANSNSNSSKEECKPRGHDCKKSQHSKSRCRCRNQKKDKDNEPKKNTWPHCKKFHCKAPH